MLDEDLIVEKIRKNCFWEISFLSLG